MIPTYNYGKYIKQAIDSVLAQDYRPLEVVVVDDGSTDNTAEIIKQYDPEIVRYYYQKKKGQPAARNLCCRKAQGEFFAWLDADDYYLPGKLTAQMNYLTEHPECEIVFTKFKNFYENEEEKSKIITRIDVMFSDKGVSHVTLLAHRSVIERIGMRDESLLVGDDADWMSRAGIVYSINVSHCIDNVYIMRRLHSTSNSFQRSTKNVINSLAKIRANYIRGRIRIKNYNVE